MCQESCWLLWRWMRRKLWFFEILASIKAGPKYVGIYFSILFARYCLWTRVKEMLSLPKSSFVLIGILEALGLLLWDVFGARKEFSVVEAACLILSVDETVKNPKVSRRVHKEMLLLERWVEGVAGQVSMAVEGECEGVELFGFEDAKDFLE
ncbi:hypothetical protein IFM89_008756 [Coptis chinensis]|uniref:Uncharacterized protein n=1 Tax=Coptis chinensis TaxID=261450 RepID=A0A835LIA1_9MAGN|nr:hypothetical protein IFM89_008756 [Coptis chinensis]